MRSSMGMKRQTELISVDLATIRRGDAGADLVLMPYDTLVIKPIPMWMEPGMIEVAGEVRFPGKVPDSPGGDLAFRAAARGRITPVAFPEGAVFIREELKEREKEQLELLANRMQSDLAALSLEASRAAPSQRRRRRRGRRPGTRGRPAAPRAAAQRQAGRPPRGRYQRRPEREPSGGPEDVLVKDGDKLVIPKKTQEITILGEVQSPTSHVYQAGLTRDDYIAKSGGTTQKADRKRIYVVRANGDVVSGGRSGWFRRTQNIEMRPGDTIVVPLDTERVNALPMWQAVTTIIYNLAVALLAVRSV